MVLLITAVALISVLLGRITGGHALVLLTILLLLYSDEMYQVMDVVRSTFAEVPT